MRCQRCKKRFEDEGGHVCPHCGAVNQPATSGVVRTSTILISAGLTDAVYRSVSDVPDPLRTRLLKSTSGLNSATILIADRRGREELAKAIRRLPANVQQRLFQTVFGTQPDGAVPGFLQPYWRRAVAVFLAVVTCLVLTWASTRKWSGPEPKPKPSPTSVR